MPGRAGEWCHGSQGDTREWGLGKMAVFNVMVRKAWLGARDRFELLVHLLLEASHAVHPPLLEVK